MSLCLLSFTLLISFAVWAPTITMGIMISSFVWICFAFRWHTFCALWGLPRAFAKAKPMLASLGAAMIFVWCAGADFLSQYHVSTRILVLYSLAFPVTLFVLSRLNTEPRV